MESKDVVRFRHMFDSVAALLTFVKGRKRAHLNNDRLFANAIVRELEVLGEAANRISKKTQRQFPSIPWKQMIGMRNTLIHAYFEVDYDVVWETIKNDLPGLHKRLEEIMFAIHS